MQQNRAIPIDYVLRNFAFYTSADDDYIESNNNNTNNNNNSNNDGDNSLLSSIRISVPLNDNSIIEKEKKKKNEEDDPDNISYVIAINNLSDKIDVDEKLLNEPYKIFNVFFFFLCLWIINSLLLRE
jgi:negative regulator of genetic competence, sporulation and motility